MPAWGQKIEYGDYREVTTPEEQFQPIQTHLRPDQLPAEVYLRSLAGGPGRRAMRAALHRVAQTLTGGKLDAHSFPWGELRYPHVIMANDMQRETSVTVATINKTLSGIRGVLRCAWNMGMIPHEAMLRAIQVPNLRGRRVSHGRLIGPEHLSRLFAACEDGTALGIRDGAAISLLFGCGLRRQEVADARLENYRAADNVLFITGKGNKEREVFLPKGTKEALTTWLRIRTDEPGALINPICPTGRVLHYGHVSSRSIQYWLTKRIRLARIPYFSPHDLRRTNITTMLDNGFDTLTVSKAAGHASPTTTARYDMRGRRAVQAAFESVAVPTDSGWAD